MLKFEVGKRYGRKTKWFVVEARTEKSIVISWNTGIEVNKRKFIKNDVEANEYVVFESGVVGAWKEVQ